MFLPKKIYMAELWYRCRYAMIKCPLNSNIFGKQTWHQSDCPHEIVGYNGNLWWYGAVFHNKRPFTRRLNTSSFALLGSLDRWHHRRHEQTRRPTGDEIDPSMRRWWGDKRQVVGSNHQRSLLRLWFCRDLMILGILWSWILDILGFLGILSTIFIYFLVGQL